MQSFYSRFLESATRYPDHVAVELQHTSSTLECYTYAELRRQAESVGRWLNEAESKLQGARCAIMAANSPLWVSAYLGVMASGAISVPLDTAFNAEQVNKLLRDSGSAFIFSDLKHLPVVKTAIQGTSTRIVLLDGPGEPSIPNLTGMFATGPEEFEPAAASLSDPAVIMYTSGTTSDPKGVVLTHGNLMAEATAIFDILHVDSDDTILGVLPLFHALAQMANLLLPFAAGARIVYLEALNTGDLLRALSERGVTLFVCVPQFFYLIHERVMQQVKQRGRLGRAAFRLMMGVSAAGRRAGLNPGKLFFRQVHNLLGARMRYLITGGSAFDRQVGRDLHNLGFDVLQVYGLTETSGAAAATAPVDNVLGSVGKPLKGVQVRILDPQSMEDIDYPVGEIAIAGGIVMPGYYNRPSATAESIHEGWLRSGDLGYFDRHGNLFIAGRKKEIIVLSSGKNIYPEEIETHYLGSPFIEEVCVMGLMSKHGEPVSERLHAVIVPDFDVLRERKIVNAREVIKFDVENLSMELPSTKRILSFDIWPEPLPRTTTRKLKRFEIQRRQQASAGRPSDAGDPAQAASGPTAAEALWLADADVQRAVAVVRRSTKAPKPVLPADNLELDLGFDSMERVELVVNLERELDTQVDKSVISEVYTVRELVDTVLKARGGAHTEQSEAPGWERILEAEPDDPAALSALKNTSLLTFLWHLSGFFVSMISRLFFDLQVSGKEKLPASGPFILCPNHQSFLDAPVVASQIPWRFFKEMFYVGTSEIFGEGMARKLASSIKLVPVDPDSNLVNAMRAGAYGLKHNKILVLYPEGERSIDGTPKKFKKGAAILSVHLKVPIYPVAIEGFYDAWPRHRKFPRLSKLRIRFGDPIFPPETLVNPEETYRELTEQLRSRVVEMWEGLRQRSYSEQEIESSSRIG
ncbi:MAG TPA: AMP-binding protein [Candidatus Saccharimonadales bacterium]|jgi:long-chain acyl-CoA synthetase|nr:AMP-binding protein [Candidatus Saccharimonadales bacterium]